MCLGIGVWSIIGGGMRRSKGYDDRDCEYFKKFIKKQQNAIFFGEMCVFIEVFKDTKGKEK